MLCEMQSVSARIWTRVAVSISYDDNHHTTKNTNTNDLYTIVIYKNLFQSQINHSFA